MFRKLGFLLLSRLFPYFEKLGIHVLPVHYYSPIPEVGKLREEIWQRVSELPGINMNKEIQLKLLEEFEKYSDEFNSFPLQKRRRILRFQSIFWIRGCGNILLHDPPFQARKDN